MTSVYNYIVNLVVWQYLIALVRIPSRLTSQEVHVEAKTPPNRRDPVVSPI